MGVNLPRTIGKHQPPKHTSLPLNLGGGGGGPTSKTLPGRGFKEISFFKGGGLGGGSLRFSTFLLV